MSQCLHRQPIPYLVDKGELTLVEVINMVVLMKELAELWRAVQKLQTCQLHECSQMLQACGWMLLAGRSSIGSSP